MKLVGVQLKNFRGFRDSGRVSIGDLTAFVGENDVGKSSVLEALDIFFNGKTAESPLTGDDFNVDGRIGSSAKLEIRCFFSGCDCLAPEKEDEAAFSPKKEGLLNGNGELEIVRRYTRSGGVVSQTPETFLCLYRRFVVSRDIEPVSEENLLDLTVPNLLLFCKKKSLSATSKMTAPELRRIIREAGACKIERTRNGFEYSLKSKSGQAIWARIEPALPLFNLFRSDRENNDGEDVIQFPIKAAVRDCFGNNPAIQAKLDEVAQAVSESIGALMKRTVEKIAEFDPHAVTALKPAIPKTPDLKWTDVFRNVSLQSGETIALNRRGSGVKRLVLLGFFKARAEEPDGKKRETVFAIEEPETAQHFEHQRQLTDALQKLAGQDGMQVLLTTHSPVVVSRLSLEDVRIVRRENGVAVVEPIDEKLLLVPKKTPSNGTMEVSMNEINYLVFGECRSEYHDELFGYLDEKYGTGKEHTMKLLRKERPDDQSKVWNRKGKNPGPEDCSVSYYIRNYIHHPESRGTDNPPPTDAEWRQSIDFMRTVIKDGGVLPKQTKQQGAQK